MAKTPSKAAAPPKAPAGKAKAGTATAPKSGSDVGTALIPVLKSTAMSVEVGPIVLQTIAAYTRDERQMGELKKSITTKQYEALAAMTAGIVKAAKADNSIRLEQVFVGDKASKARMNNQIYFALGLKQAYTVGKPGAEKQRIDWTPQAAELVKPNKDDPTDVTNQKGTIRTNLAHMLTKCTQAAVGIIDDDLKIETDKDSGSLKLTGPSLAKHFGDASIVLNEKQNVQVTDKKGKVIGEKKLNVKPSFTEIARRAAEAHGKVHATRVDSRKVTVDPNKHIIDLAKMLLEQVNKMKKPLATEVKTALESVYNAIDEKL